MVLWLTALLSIIANHFVLNWLFYLPFERVAGRIFQIANIVPSLMESPRHPRFKNDYDSRLDTGYVYYMYYMCPLSAPEVPCNYLHDIPFYCMTFYIVVYISPTFHKSD